MPTWRWKAGAIVQVPCGRGQHTYGQALAFPFMAFHDCRTKGDAAVDAIAASPVLFVIAVHKSVQRAGRKNGWFESMKLKPARR